MIRFAKPLLASALVLAVTVPAMAQSARVLGDFRDWSSYAADDGSGTMCFAMTKPKTTQPTPDGYGEAYLYITNRPGEDVSGEFNVVAGYTFQTGSMATVSIGGQNFALFTRHLRHRHPGGTVLFALRRHRRPAGHRRRVLRPNALLHRRHCPA